MMIDSILALDDGLEEYVWPIAILIISLVSWLAAKAKEWSGQAKEPRQAARSDAPEAEEEKPVVVDLAELLGLAERQQKPPRHPPVATTVAAPVAAPVERVARPAPPPVPPEPRQTEPVQHVIDATLLEAEPAVSVHVFPGDLTRSKPPSSTTTTTAGRRILGALTRNELRRGIILREILGKPVALRDLTEY